MATLTNAGLVTMPSSGRANEELLTSDGESDSDGHLTDKSWQRQMEKKMQRLEKRVKKSENAEQRHQKEMQRMRKQLQDVQEQMMRDPKHFEKEYVGANGETIFYWDRDEFYAQKRDEFQGNADALCKLEEWYREAKKTGQTRIWCCLGAAGVLGGLGGAGVGYGIAVKMGAAATATATATTGGTVTATATAVCTTKMCVAGCAIGATVGGVALLVLAIGGIYYYIQHRKKKTA